MTTPTLLRVVDTIRRRPDARLWWAGHLPAPASVDLGVELDVVCRLALCRWPASADEVVAAARDLSIDADRMAGLWARMRD